MPFLSSKLAAQEQTLERKEIVRNMGDQTPCAAFFNVLSKVKPYVTMLSLQFGYAGMYIISSVSLKRGMSNFILATYCQAVATIVIAPFALYFERRKRPQMTLPIFLSIVLLGFLGPVVDQNLNYLGMKYTTATYASAFGILLPAVTFILAMIFRIERINLSTIPNLAKIIGTAIKVAGTIVMTLYKGPIIDYITSEGAANHGSTSESADENWVTATIMLLGSVLSRSCFFILLYFTLKRYRAVLSLTALICFMGMVEAAVVSLIMVRDLSAWKLGWDSRLLAATNSGIACFGVAYYVQGVVSRDRGPVFVTSFSPLCMIITALLGVFVLKEKIHLGSIFGAIIAAIGHST